MGGGGGGCFPSNCDQNFLCLTAIILIENSRLSVLCLKFPWGAIFYKNRLSLCDIPSRRALNLKALSLSDIPWRLTLQLKASSRCSKLGTFWHTIKVSCITQNTVNLWHTIKASSKIKSRRVILWDTIKANSITQTNLTVTFNGLTWWQVVLFTGWFLYGLTCWGVDLWLVDFLTVWFVDRLTS